MGVRGGEGGGVRGCGVGGWGGDDDESSVSTHMQSVWQ